MKAVLVRRSKVEPAPASGVLLTMDRKPLTRWKGAGAEDHSIMLLAPPAFVAARSLEVQMPATVPPGTPA